MAESLVYTIDDDDDFNMLLKMSLQQYNIKVVTHSNPLEFTASVKERIPDLCMLDLNLDPNSGGEGFQLLRAMRSVIGKELPIFIMSKRGTKDDVFKAMDMGATDFVPKPLDDKYLLIKLKTILENNKDLEDIDVTYSFVDERDHNADIKTEFRVKKVSAEELEIESELFLSKEINIYLEGDVLEEIYGSRRLNFKVIDSWQTDEGVCGAKMERELSHEELFSLRRWMVKNTLSTPESSSNSESEKVKEEQ